MELRALAAAKLAHEPAGQTLDATALVHEAWLRLAGASFEWADRTHFARAAAAAMRRVLVDRARAKRAVRRDGGRRVALPDPAAPLPDEAVLDLDEALGRLAAAKPDHARLLELRYFGGLTGAEAAAALGCRRRPPTAWPGTPPLGCGWTSGRAGRLLTAGRDAAPARGGGTPTRHRRPVH